MEGLRSWVGEGWRFMEAVWIVSAISTGREDDIFVVSGVGSGVGEGVEAASMIALPGCSRTVVLTRTANPLFNIHINCGQNLPRIV